MNKLNVLECSNNIYMFNKKVINEDEVFNLLLNDEDKNSDSIYNIGNLLNIPYYYTDISCKWNLSKTKVDNKRIPFENSFVKYYYDSFIEGKDVVPDPVSINNSFNNFISYKKMNYYEEVFNKDDVLVVHLRTGDLGDAGDYYKKILQLSKNFNKIFILVGIHNRGQGHPDVKKSENVKPDTINSISTIFKNIDNIKILIGGADEHLCIMKYAKNLLVHKGSYSVLGCILCSGNIYITKVFNAGVKNGNNDRWNNMIKECNKNINFI